MLAEMSGADISVAVDLSAISPAPSTHMVTQAIMWPNMLERAWIWGDTGAHACTTRGCGHLVMSPQRKYLFYTLTPELHNG